MLNKKVMAGLLASAMILTNCGVTVFADEAASTTEAVETEGTETEDTAETEAEEAETEKAELKVIGEKTENSYEVEIKNLTGKDILGVAIKEISEEAFPENMLSEGDVFTAEESRVLYFTPAEEVSKEDAEVAGEEGAEAEGEAENAEAAEGAETAEAAEATEGTEAAEAAGEAATEASEEYGDEKLLQMGYDIELTFAEDQKAVLHSFPFEEAESFEIYMEESVAYVRYKIKDTEEEISTLDAEKMIAGVEEPAPQEETVVYTEETYYDPNAYYYDPNTYYDPNAYYYDPNTYYYDYSYSYGGGDTGCIGGDALVY